MTYTEEIAEFRRTATALSDEFRDSSGLPIQIGDLVHYNRDREDWEKPTNDEWYSVWTKDRWGIVTDLIKTAKFDYEARQESTTEFDYSVHVSSVNVITHRLQARSRDSWSADPTSVEVVSP